MRVDGVDNMKIISETIKKKTRQKIEAPLEFCKGMTVMQLKQQIRPPYLSSDPKTYRTFTKYP